MTDLKRLTVDTVPDLWRQHAEIFAADHADLGGLEHIDSAGIAFLLQWSKHTERGTGRRLRLLQVSERLQGLLTTYHLNRFFST